MFMVFHILLQYHWRKSSKLSISGSEVYRPKVQLNLVSFLVYNTRLSVHGIDPNKIHLNHSEDEDYGMNLRCLH